MRTTVLALAMTLLLGACFGADDSGTSGTASGRPTAEAGGTQAGTVGVPLALDGSASSDPEGDTLTYQWTVLVAPPGSVATLSDATAAAPSFTPDVEGTWAFQLEVSDGVNVSVPDVAVVTTVWTLNDAGDVAAVFTNTDGSPIVVDVASLEYAEVGGIKYFRVRASGIPSYTHVVTAADVDWLDNGQPDSKMSNGSGTTLIAGATVDLGDDVGYKVTLPCFAATNGGGWFPPGPSCPLDQAHDFYIPAEPIAALATCYTREDSIGVYRNGVAMFNWSDAQTYNDAGVWHQLAAKFEVHDLDLCSSHANPPGTYHHHIQPNCLAEALGDTGTAHSPVFGYAADGYPIHGLWFANGVKAQSCWKTRDYDTPDATTGCAVAKSRACLLVDNSDPSAGKVAAATPGPDTDAIVMSDGGDSFTAESGYYFEDYWFDATCAALGGENLDEHNGHDHDGYGYHYHQTEDFPYNAGPAYAGALTADTIVSTCSATPAAAPSAPTR